MVSSDYKSERLSNFGSSWQTCAQLCKRSTEVFQETDYLSGSTPLKRNCGFPTSLMQLWWLELHLHIKQLQTKKRFKCSQSDSKGSLVMNINVKLPTYTWWIFISWFLHPASLFFIFYTPQTAVTLKSVKNETAAAYRRLITSDCPHGAAHTDTTHFGLLSGCQRKKQGSESCRHAAASPSWSYIIANILSFVPDCYRFISD